MDTPPAPLLDEPPPIVSDAPSPPNTQRRAEYGRMAALIGAAWLLTNVPLTVMKLPLNYLLADEVRLSAEQIATFLAIATFSNYVKPIFGLLTDSVPLFGTLRRSYVLLGLLLAGMGYFALPFVSRGYWPLLVAYAALYCAVVLVSTVLGGVMVEIGHRFGATGRLSAQRVGIVRAIPLFAGPVGGILATVAFFWPSALAGLCHLLLIPVIVLWLREPRTETVRTAVWVGAWEQLRILIRNRMLWAGVGLIVLVIAAPGFDTPLFFYQTRDLKFSKPFMGVLEMVQGVGALLGAAVYALLCSRFTLRAILASTIVIDAVTTLVYLAYRSETSAFFITGMSGMTNILAVLPLYDLCIRVTTRGGEGLGYSVMMSCWNLTASVSNIVGSYLYSSLHFSFFDLVWVNAVTTGIVIVAVPFLPRVLMDRREGFVPLDD